MALATVAAVAAMVRPAVAMPASGASTSGAAASGEEPREERVELGDPLLGNVDGDLLVLGVVG